LRRTANAAARIDPCIGRAPEHWSFSARRWASSLHMWIGAATMLYLLFMCLSGCVILFERDLFRMLSPDPVLESVSVPRLSGAELIDVAFRRYPEHHVIGVWDKKVSADVIAEIWLDGRDGLHRRLLNPYTGADLGTAQPLGLQILSMIRQSHTNLVTGRLGQYVNGLGSLVLMLLAASSLLSWILRKPEPRSRPARFSVPALHRQVGFWMLPFAITWGATGLILSVPASLGRGTVEWPCALHTGMNGAWMTATAWAACSLLTSTLLVAGAWAWWRKPAKKLQVCWAQMCSAEMHTSGFRFLDPRHHRRPTTWTCRQEG
jgi:uncharacterized iron-regulated membrane protein